MKAQDIRIGLKVVMHEHPYANVYVIAEEEDGEAFLKYRTGSETIDYGWEEPAYFEPATKEQLVNHGYYVFIGASSPTIRAVPAAHFLNLLEGKTMTVNELIKELQNLKKLGYGNEIVTAWDSDSEKYEEVTRLEHLKDSVKIYTEGDLS